MKLTKKQQEEVNYLKTWNKSGITITDEHIEEYINSTVYGKGDGGKMSKNPLITAKQRLEITLALWKEDLTIGLISFQELLDDATCDFERKLIYSIRDSVSPKYRKEAFLKHKHVKNDIVTYPVATSFSCHNFNDVSKKFASAFKQLYNIHMIKKVEKGTKINQIHLGAVGDVELFASIPYKDETEYKAKEDAIILLFHEVFEVIAKKLKPKKPRTVKKKQLCHSKKDTHKRQYRTTSRKR